MRLVDGDNTGGVRIDMGAVEVQPEPQPPSLLGDYNLDNVVNAADYTEWRDNLGQSVTPYSTADGDGNGVIDNGDYVVWRDHFGDTPTPSTLVAASVGDAGEPFFLSPSLPAGTARRSASQPVAEASSSGFWDDQLLLLALREITGDDPTEEPSDWNRHREPLSQESAAETLELAFSEWD